MRYNCSCMNCLQYRPRLGLPGRHCGWCRCRQGLSTLTSSPLMMALAETAFAMLLFVEMGLGLEPVAQEHMAVALALPIPVALQLYKADRTQTKWPGSHEDGTDGKWVGG